MSQYRQLVHVAIQAIGACLNTANWCMSKYRQLVHVSIQAIGACRNTGNWCMSKYRQLVHVTIQAIGACRNTGNWCMSQCYASLWGAVSEVSSHVNEFWSFSHKHTPTTDIATDKHS